MRLLIAATALMAHTATVEAADCTFGSQEILRLVEWRVESLHNDRAELSLSYENTSGQGIKMIEGYTNFFDPLGRELSAVYINPDFEIDPSEIKSDVAGSHFRRSHLLTEPDSVFAVTCIVAVLYENGEIEEF